MTADTAAARITAAADALQDNNGRLSQILDPLTVPELHALYTELTTRSAGTVTYAANGVVREIQFRRRHGHA